VGIERDDANRTAVDSAGGIDLLGHLQERALDVAPRGRGATGKGQERADLDRVLRLRGASATPERKQGAEKRTRGY
jgi:hypothetical protein